METSSPPHPVTGLPAHLHRQPAHAPAGLPPPLNDAFEALRARKHTAVDRREWARFAAYARAEEILLLPRQRVRDTGLAMRLSVQHTFTVGASLSVLGCRAQAVRRKREATESAAAEDSWAARGRAVHGQGSRPGRRTAGSGAAQRGLDRDVGALYAPRGQAAHPREWDKFPGRSF